MARKDLPPLQSEAPGEFSRSLTAALLACAFCAALPSQGAERDRTKALPIDLAAWEHNPRSWEQPRTFFADRRLEGGPDGLPWLSVRAFAPGWNNLLIRRVAPERPAAKVEFTGFARVKDVRAGSSHYMAARAQLSFHCADTGMVGGWPEGVIMDGTSDWTPFRTELDVPQGAGFIEVMLGLVNCTGEAGYAGLELRAFDAKGEEVPLRAISGPERTDTSGWRRFPGGAPGASGDEGLDLRELLGREVAGSRGVLRRGGEGGLTFADGTPARFWGVNICPPMTWPDSESAAALAERLARAGVNLARIHHLDRGWSPDNIFEADANHTQSFDGEKLARMDFLIHELRQRGIHIYFDLLVTRRFREGDGVAAHDRLPLGAKMAAHFDRRIIELQKDYARRLLTRRNPHTGLTYADDPAVVMVSIINESSLFLDGSLGVSLSALPDFYRGQLDDLFADWLRSRGSGRADQGLTVEGALRANEPEVFDFLEETQNRFYDEMAAFLRDELGLRALIAGSNFQETPADMRSNMRLDFYDVHGYWAHPIEGWAPTDEAPATALVRVLNGGNPFRSWASQRFAGLPFVISEWQAAWPNETGYQMPLLMALTASRQNWDAAAWFVFDTPAWGSRMEGCFSAGDKPHYLPGFVAGALLFRRGDIPPAALRVVPFQPAGPRYKVEEDLAGIDLLNERIIRAPGAQGAAAAAEAASGPGDCLVRWEKGKRVVFVSERAAGAVGFFEGDRVEAGGMVIRIENPGAQVALVSLDGEPLRSSRRLLLLASARAENTGQSYRPLRRGLIETGGPPILVEPVLGWITLPPETGQARWTARMMDWDGRVSGGAFSVEDGMIKLGELGAPWFLLERDGAGQ